MTPSCEEGMVGGARAADAAPEVTIRPEPSVWRSLVAKIAADEQAKQFRRELGMPNDRPVIMSGHQAQVWHPGILAKLIALDAAGERQGAAAAWVVVDHDDNDPLTVRAPVNGAGGLEMQTFGPARLEGEDVPACRRAAWVPGASWALAKGSNEAATGVVAGLERVRGAFARHAGAGDAAAQARGAAFELAKPWARVPTVIRGSALSGTGLFAELVKRMVKEPRACVEAHNAAVAEFPHERIAPLSSDGADIELPLWTIGAEMGSARRKVFASELRGLPVQSLAPRALLLTGLMRLAGCELFIHGLGGERYDRITELWLGKWLGKTLAPTAMVTATMRLRIAGSWPTQEEIAHAAWLAHRARHDPGVLHDMERAAAKRELLAKIDNAPRKSSERRAAFVRMHDVLHELERVHAEELAALDGEAAALHARAAEAAIAMDRTWAFALYEAEQLDALREAVRAQFA